MNALIKGRLWIKILISMVLGLGFGILIGPTAGLVAGNISKVLGIWLAFPGQLFLALIQMIVLPLVFSSIIRGLTTFDNLDQLRTLGLKVVVYFLLTTTIAITIGIVITSVVKPGKYIDSELINNLELQQSDAASTDTTNVDSNTQPGELPNLHELPSKIVNILPQNPMRAMLDLKMFQVVIFSIIVGIALLTMSGSQSKPLLALLESVQEVCMTIVRWAMELAPYAVFGLLANLTSQIGLQVLVGMAAYVGTVLGGLLLLLGFYILIVIFIGKKPPGKFLSDVREVQLLAFGTSSSAAVMPLSIEIAENKLGVRSSIAHFLVPLGATINMDGTALYQGAATVFLAQVFGVDLSLATLVLITVTAVSASIGAPAAPGVGIVILSMVLESAGIPTSGIALIIGVDRILDMSRTAVNVTGDLTACIVMNRWASPGFGTESDTETNEMNAESDPDHD